MTDSQTTPQVRSGGRLPPGLRQLVQTGPGINTRLLFGGAVLMGIGGAIGLTGFVLGTSAVIAATRRWVQQMETPPGELAKQHWARAKTATSAGVGVWRNGQQIQQVPSSRATDD
jgi:hypothetical protein